MDKKKLRASIYVLIQFITPAFIFFTGPFFSTNILLQIIQLAAILFGIWAIIIMRIPNLRITPIPKNHFTLITSGPYKYIRHPMYLALLTAFIPPVISNFTIFRFVCLLLLLFVLLLKINFEEKLLKNASLEYVEYKAKTKKLIPFIY